MQPARADVDALRQAMKIARIAQNRLVPPHYDEGDIARVVVEALYSEGALRTSMRTWRRPPVEQVA
jgi:hypothetical protein